MEILPEDLLFARTPNVLKQSLSEIYEKLKANFEQEFNLQKTLLELKCLQSKN